jgi:23S rRNA (uridine2552-2'-O)-methyltransferase
MVLMTRVGVSNMFFPDFPPYLAFFSPFR